MGKAPRIIRKYPNRRLYDIANGGYITLAVVKQLVLKDVVFQVVDARSGADLTRATLLQIILDEESGAAPMFSSEMFAEIVRFHGAAQQSAAGVFLEESVKTFLRIQSKLQDPVPPGHGNSTNLTPDLWCQLLRLQAPDVEAMLGNFLERSAKRIADEQ